VDGQLAWFMKSQKKHTMLELRANRKNVHPVVKNKKLRNGEHCDQHS
jgi:hypothetical protein